MLWKVVFKCLLIYQLKISSKNIPRVELFSCFKKKKRKWAQFFSSKHNLNHNIFDNKICVVRFVSQIMLSENETIWLRYPIILKIQENIKIVT